MANVTGARLFPGTRTVYQLYTHVNGHTHRSISQESASSASGGKVEGTGRERGDVSYQLNVFSRSTLPTWAHLSPSLVLILPRRKQG